MTDNGRSDSLDARQSGASGDAAGLGCREAILALAAYLDGELESASRGRLEEHLEICKSCYSRHEFEKGLKQRLADLGEEKVRPGFQARIRSLVSRFDSIGDRSS